MMCFNPKMENAVVAEFRISNRERVRHVRHRGAVPLMKASRKFFPFVEIAFADSAYNSDRVAEAASISIEIVRKHPEQVGFAVHPRRCVVQRFLVWLPISAAKMTATRNEAPRMAW